jgi:hypothetical protein
MIHEDYNLKVIRKIKYVIKSSKFIAFRNWHIYLI